MLEVNNLSKGTKDFAHLQVPVFIADRIGLNLGDYYGDYMTPF